MFFGKRRILVKIDRKWTKGGIRWERRSKTCWSRYEGILVLISDTYSTHSTNILRNTFVSFSSTCRSTSTILNTLPIPVHTGTCSQLTIQPFMKAFSHSIINLVCNSIIHFCNHRYIQLFHPSMVILFKYYNIQFNLIVHSFIKSIIHTFIHSFNHSIHWCFIVHSLIHSCFSSIKGI